MVQNRDTTTWQLRKTLLSAGQIPLLMGIVNLTPDSFSDGGKYFKASAAVEHALQLISEGADLIDIGGQSTRPGATRVEAAEELRRILPVVERLTVQTTTPISVDTFSAAVARKVLDAGAEAINDVTALNGDAEMLDIVRSSGCGVCIMHMQGTPATMQLAPAYDDVCGEVESYLRTRRDVLVSNGVAANRIAVDPGIGFGKTFDHNLALLRNLEQLQAIGQPVVVGVSRKAFIGTLLGDANVDRTYGTIGAALAAALAGATVLRVHDVAAVKQACTAFAALVSRGRQSSG